MGKKPIVSVTYENERISIKNSLPNLKCVLRLCCVVHGPIYGRFMGLPLGKQVFFPYKSLYLECHATMPMLADAHIWAWATCAVNDFVRFPSRESLLK